jgi:hypothetical protein
MAGKGVDENNQALSQLSIAEGSGHHVVSTYSPSPSPTPEGWRGFSRSVSPSYSPTSSPSPSPSDPPPSVHPPLSPNHEGRRPPGPEPTLATVSEEVLDRDSFPGKSNDSYSGGDGDSESTVHGTGMDGQNTHSKEDEAGPASRHEDLGESAAKRVQVAPWPDIGSMSLSCQMSVPSLSSASNVQSGKSSLLRRRTQTTPLQEISSSLKIAVGEEAYKNEHGTVVMPWPKIVDADYKCMCSCGSGSFGEVYKAVRVRLGFSYVELAPIDVHQKLQACDICVFCTGAQEDRPSRCREGHGKRQVGSAGSKCKLL